MLSPWHIYHVRDCRHTTPPKDKYVVVVCFNPNPYGFLVNSKIASFIKNRPEMLSSQVPITAKRYGFLKRNSYIDCARLFSFKKGDLHSVQDVQNNTKKEIRKVIATSRLIEPIYRKLICGKYLPT